VSRLSGARDGLGERNAWSRAAWTTNAAYVNFARTVRRLSFETGARASYATLMHQQAVTPWVAGAWQFKPGWTMNASAGASRQFPNLDAVLGAAEGSELVPERATHVDVGLAQQLSGFRWQVTLFTRAERDVLRGSVLEPRQLVSGFDSAQPVGYQNGLDGLTRGVELVVIRQNPARVSGWMSYAYAASRQTDASTGASFWSDTDRHHAFNAAGLFRIGRQASAGFVIRAASGVPMPAFVTPSDGEDVGGDPHYVARVGSYVRLDARVQRTFFSATHAVTLFGEVLNALNRRDAGIATRFIQSGSGEATGAATSSASRRVFGGIEVVLSR
jgi:outer membrane cobalamin receptor